MSPVDSLARPESAAPRRPMAVLKLSGRDLPPDAALSAMASVNARAEEYKDSGAFGDALMDQYRATAYVDLLGNVAAWERIAYGCLISAGPAPGTDGLCAAGSGHPDEGDDDDGDQDGPDSDNPGPGSPDSGGSGSGGSARDNAPGARRAGGAGSCSSDGGGAPLADDRRAGQIPAGEDLVEDQVSEDQVSEDLAGNPGPVDGSGAGLAAGGGGSLPRGAFPFQRPPLGPPGYLPRLTDLVLPLATLQGNASRPGESHGFGILDPGLCRHLAGLAIRSIHTTLCVTVTDPDGTAIGHGCLRLVDHAGGPPDNRPREPTSGPTSLGVLSARDLLLAAQGDRRGQGPGQGSRRLACLV
jgi:hypothetical protein